MSDAPPTVRYDRAQTASTILAGLGMGAFLCFVGLVVALTSARGRDSRALTEMTVLLGVCLVVLVTIGFVFRRLRVVVTDAEVFVSFGSGWPRRRVALGRIRAARIVRSSWWHGWGIRLTPHGWLWNADGFDAVELDLHPDWKFRIGTDDTKGLLQAIESARGGHRG
jgi:hypothetical protein